MGDIITPYFPDKFPLNNAVGYFIPQPHSTIEIAEMMEYWYRAYPQFDKELAKYNLKTIGFRPLEHYGIICTKPIKSIEDFKGKRIRTYGFAYPAFVQALGGTPVSMSSTDGYEALQRGILDCSPIGPSLAHGWKYDEVAKYYIDVPIGASFGHMITMNLNSYKKLDEQTRAIIDGLGREYAMRYTDRPRRPHQEDRRGLEGQGRHRHPSAEGAVRQGRSTSRRSRRCARSGSRRPRPPACRPRSDRHRLRPLSREPDTPRAASQAGPPAACPREIRTPRCPPSNASTAPTAACCAPSRLISALSTFVMMVLVVANVARPLSAQQAADRHAGIHRVAAGAHHLSVGRAHAI